MIGLDKLARSTLTAMMLQKLLISPALIVFDSFLTDDSFAHTVLRKYEEQNGEILQWLMSVTVLTSLQIDDNEVEIRFYGF